ncbi:aldehyde dehydrogenase family protein [Microbacterium pseudoresistens]|uniref:Acyl-CoA reductase-like NAD-dependent aldehyde dehydrogenase n=1 Tax=Microbacterium pseudoresistens TaxID=640634 RepID=A0A7Y9JML2_9MICO|nr:aldehyde dehydrogenase family protein [Microbacterium pseudoresistens]NYD54907.1 acyl-CoA reductase-like NAD-dependent aldehyde dehydrogenase [Microbacterium pseudoresistens]
MSSTQNQPAITAMTIGGTDRLAADGATIDTLNPATGKVIGRFPAATKADVDSAVDAAATAFEEWRRFSPQRRQQALNAFADIIDQHQDELMHLDVAENGTPVREMRRDAQKASRQLRYFAWLSLEAKGHTVPTDWDRVNFSLRQPWGVVGKIIPFNHPLMFAAAKIAAPLAAGNAVVLKPSEFTSLSALRLGELSRGILPDGVLNVITGYGATTGDSLVRHPDVRRLAFIGSATTGRAIQRAAAEANVKNITLELGGKNPLVVFGDADIDKAVAAAQRGMNFTWQGQSCGSTSRLLVQEEVYEEFVNRLGASLDAMKQGDPADEGTDTGAIVNEPQFAKVKMYIEIGKQEGRLIAGGTVSGDEDSGGGMFVRPTLFADIDPGARLAQEEIFGPVLAATSFRDYDDALRKANDSQYGLTASVFTSDLRTAMRFARDVEAGYVWVNEVSRHVEGTAFGGYKDSGVGREEDIDELLSYTQAKNVHIVCED